PRGAGNMSLDLIRRQREEKLRRLREKDSIEPTWEKEEDPYLKYELEDEDENLWGEPDYAPHAVKSTFFIKMIISLFILSIAYVIYHTDSPVSKQGQRFISEVMTREFNFQGVIADVEHRFGIDPSIFPVMNMKAFSSHPAWMPGS